jgi:hypothetical protein
MSDAPGIPPGRSARGLAPPPWPPLEVVNQALRLLKDGEALDDSPGAGLIAAVPTAAYRDLIGQLGGPYVLRVICGHRGCTGTLGKWRMDPGTGIAVVHDEPTRGADRSVPRPFTAAAAANKGYRTGSTTPDGAGTYTAECKRCRHRHDFGVRFRTRLFLTALARHHKTIQAE